MMDLLRRDLRRKGLANDVELAAETAMIALKLRAAFKRQDDYGKGETFRWIEMLGNDLASGRRKQLAFLTFGTVTPVILDAILIFETSKQYAKVIAHLVGYLLGSL